MFRAVPLLFLLWQLLPAQSRIHSLTGFAQAATGGGILPETDPAYRQAYTPNDLVTALDDKSTKVIEIMNDLLLGFNEIDPTARIGPLRSASAPLLHPTLLASGVSRIDIQDKDGLTIFSTVGATIRHATFNIKRSSNVIIRNLKFDELWEWDEASKGDYDKQDWDFITIDINSDNIWIDHCTFTKAYDGVIDIKGGSKNVTISWCLFLGGDGGPGSFVRRQIDALERDGTAPMYTFLRASGFSPEDIIEIARPQKKGHLLGANELDPANADLAVTLHHNYYRNMQDRMPRLRAGNAHVFNIYVDNSEALAAKDRRDAVVSAMSKANASRLTSTYSFKITLNGAISTEGGAVLVEKSAFVNVMHPLRNNQKDASLMLYTGKIRSIDTYFKLRDFTFQGESDTPDSPLAAIPAPTLPFSWNGFTELPYAYVPNDDPAGLLTILTHPDGAAAGVVWPRAEWLKTSY
ncbi:MAG: hypothetical protein HY820_35565 [Acidobacteria bacterium]|nr:hypothetical protein [Acidobacteriota bacterium]